MTRIRIRRPPRCSPMIAHLAGFQELTVGAPAEKAQLLDSRHILHQRYKIESPDPGRRRRRLEFDQLSGRES